jgi:hypothetical protein
MAPVDGAPDATIPVTSCTPGSCGPGQTCCLASAVAGSGGTFAFSGVCAEMGTCPGPFSVACTSPAGCADAGANGLCCASLTYPSNYSLAEFLPPTFDLSEFTSTLEASTFDASGFGLDISCQTTCAGPTQIQLCSSDGNCPSGYVCTGASGDAGAALEGVMGCVLRADAGSDASALEAGAPEAGALDAGGSDATADSASTDASADSSSDAASSVCTGAADCVAAGHPTYICCTNEDGGPASCEPPGSGNICNFQSHCASGVQLCTTNYECDSTCGDSGECSCATCNGRTCGSF